MSSAGHILDMIRRQRQNRNLQKQARERYRQKLKSFESKPLDQKYNWEKFPPITDEQKKIIRSEVRAEMRIYRRNSILKTITFVLVAGVLILILRSFL